MSWISIIMGITMFIGGFTIIILSSNYLLISPWIGAIMVVIGALVCGVSCGLYVDSGSETSVQIQEPVGETAIIKTYDINENLINEWRVK